MEPYKLFVADQMTDEGVLVWRKADEADDVESLIVNAIVLMQDNNPDIQCMIVSHYGEVVHRLYKEKEGGQVS